MFRNDKLAGASLVFLVVICLAALTSALWVRERSLKMDFSLRLAPPCHDHWFGNGPLGRDLFSRVFLALRFSLALAFVIMLLGAVIGTGLGILAGYAGGRIDSFIVQLISIVQAFPYLLFALIILFTMRPGLISILIVLVAKRWVGFARVVRAETMRQRQGRGYLVAAESIGGTHWWIIKAHLLPNLIPLVSVLAVTGIPGVIMSEATLSFLGLGLQPPQASLGLLIVNGKDYLVSTPWLALIPGLALSLIAFAFYLLSNWLTVALDPVQRWKLK